MYFKIGPLHEIEYKTSKSTISSMIWILSKLFSSAIEKKICWTSFLEGREVILFSCDNIDNIAGPKLHGQNQHCHFPGWLSYNDLISKNRVCKFNWPSIDRYQSFATIFFHNFNEHTFWGLNTTTFLHQYWKLFLFNFWRQVKLIC